MVIFQRNSDHRLSSRRSFLASSLKLGIGCSCFFSQPNNTLSEQQTEADSFCKIDAHQHFWNYTPEHYRWINHDVLKRDYMPVDLKPLMQKQGIDGTVLVEGGRGSLEDNEFMLGLADEYPFIYGVVGWIDFNASDAGEQVERFSADPQFRGIRYPLYNPDAPLDKRANFERGMKALAEKNRTYDLLTGLHSLERAIEMVKRFSDQRFIVDHIANPPIAKQVLEPWRKQIKEIASLENVSCKLSGMVTKADKDQWRYEDLVPYINTIMEAFGAKRVMIGSDWPVCLLAASYEQVMEVPKRYFAGFSHDERRDIWGENAKRVYGLS